MTIRSLLERSAYDLTDETSILEICARTSLTEQEVRLVIEGSKEATIEGIYRIALMLNVPPSELINQTNNIIQCYSIDGGRPRTLALTYDDTDLINKMSEAPLLYVEDLDGSFNEFSTRTMVLFVSRQEDIVENKLYLFEDRTSRYVRRCTSVDPASGDAAMSDSGKPANIKMVKQNKVRPVDENGEVLMGRVLMSVTMH